MRAGAAICGLMILTCLVVGCRTAQPNLKPPQQPEVGSVPPLSDARYDTPNYPKEAFNNQDLRRRDPGSDSPIIPTRGMNSPGGNMMSPGRGY